MRPQNPFETGRIFREKLHFTLELVERFAEFSGDRNPIHVNPAEAREYGFAAQVAHGAILVNLVSKVVGMEIPGPGALWMGQSIEWLHPVFVNDTIELTVKVERSSRAAGILFLEMSAENQSGKQVMKGSAKVKVMEKLSSLKPMQTGGRRVALVTGGSRGIGAEIAKQLAASGLDVAIVYKSSKEEALGLVEKIRASNSRGEAFEADVTDERALNRMLDAALRKFGHIDVVVHGASPAVPALGLTELGYEQFDSYFKAYVGAGLALMKGTCPGMFERRFGRFIFLGTSYLFGTPPAGMAAYVSAKEALLGLAKSMAVELGPKGVTCNMISPSMTVTDLTAGISPRTMELEARKSAVRRLATAEDAAQLAVFLASEGAGYLNGVNFPLMGSPV